VGSDGGGRKRFAARTSGKVRAAGNELVAQMRCGADPDLSRDVVSSSDGCESPTVNFRTRLTGCQWAFRIAPVIHAGPMWVEAG